MNYQLLEQLNTKIATKLDVSPLDILFEISEKAKSKFGHCRYKGDKQYIINISRFIVGTDLERDTLCHELCHAYDHYYFKSLSNSNDPAPHGKVWKILMKEIFGYDNVKAQGIHSKRLKIIKLNDNEFNVYEGGQSRAYIVFDGKNLSIRDPKGGYISSEEKEKIYVEEFSKFMQGNLV